MKLKNLSLSALTLCCAGAGGCAGNGEGLNGNGRPIGAGSTPVTPLTADFQSIQEHVLTPICTVCHAGGGAPQGLRLDAQNSYAMLVGVPSNEVPSILRVAPGDPSRSYLIQKLEGRAAVGARMPLGGPPLDDATIAVIRQWITDGAQRPSSAGTEDSFQLAASAPAIGDVLNQAPARLVLQFTHELDQTRIDATSLRLQRLVACSGDEVVENLPTKFTVPAGNPFAVIITPDHPLIAGRYRVVAADRSQPGLADLSGRSLDGAVSARGDVPVLTAFEVEATP